MEEDYDKTGDETGLDLGGFDDGDEEEDQSSHGQVGCSCLLYVEYTVVFRRVNNRQRFSCNRYGLERCSRYCDEMVRKLFSVSTSKRVLLIIDYKGSFYSVSINF